MGTSGGANAAITFLLLNDWDVGFDEEGLVDLVLAVASSRMAKPDRIALF
jgi:prophage maintenance system killer protein